MALARRFNEEGDDIISNSIMQQSQSIVQMAGMAMNWMQVTQSLLSLASNAGFKVQFFILLH